MLIIAAHCKHSVKYTQTYNALQFSEINTRGSETLLNTTGTSIPFYYFHRNVCTDPC